MTNARKEWAAYLTSIEVKRDAIRAKEDELAKLQGVIAAPQTTESLIGSMVRATAEFLLGRGNDASDQGAELEHRLGLERHRAEAAKLAAASVEQQIAELHQEVMDLESKEREYVTPIMKAAYAELNIQDAIEFHRKALRDLLELDRQYGADRNERQMKDVLHVRLDPRYVIGRWRGPWKNMIDALRRDPNADVRQFVRLP
jgi:hypothetical protein